MIENRVALKRDTEIEIDKTKKIIISEEAGRGASCIVYDALYADSMGFHHKIRVKEYYPVYIAAKRIENNIVPGENDTAKFNQNMSDFVSAYKKNAEIRNTLGLTNSTVNSTDIFSANNTVYISMAMDEGTDYRKYEDSSLAELFRHVKTLCEVISRYHRNEYLHLDIKPENIFIIPETDEHILLFDFDSIVTFKELRQNECLKMSFSDGFSAPEQIQFNIKKIGPATDIYSIGALLYYKLFGTKPENGMRLSGSISFDGMKYSDEKYQPKLYRKLNIFFRKTLAVSPAARWHDVNDLIIALDKLIKISDLSSFYLLDSFRYNTGCFIGREAEIAKINEILKSKQLVFISGIGGIGKTELARQYAIKYRNNYNSIVFTSYESDIKSLVCEQIIINNFIYDEDEKSDELFQRKIKILKETVSSEDLIILDNFDVESDECLEILFECPCKFLITTREDFSDYNYPQILIDAFDDMNSLMDLFGTYNEIEYSSEETESIEKIIKFVEGHTMTVEMIAKYLRDTEETPEEFYVKIIDKAGI